MNYVCVCVCTYIRLGIFFIFATALNEADAF